MKHWDLIKQPVWRLYHFLTSLHIAEQQLKACHVCLESIAIARSDLVRVVFKFVGKDDMFHSNCETVFLCNPKCGSHFLQNKHGVTTAHAHKV